MKFSATLFSLFLIVISNNIFSQVYNLPDLIYYRFEDNPAATAVTNYAVPGVGNTTGTLTNLTLSTNGQFDSCMSGTATASAKITTGYNLTTGTSSFTISMWLNNLPLAPASTRYLFGDPGHSFRCFIGGVAPSGGAVLRGTGLTDVQINNIIPGPSVVHIVYDSAASNIKIYKNGSLINTVSQTPINFSAGNGFSIGGYSSSAGLEGLMDEFRFYKRALDTAEISFTWDKELPTIVPVELTSFTADYSDDVTTLIWQTATELNNLGFDIERTFVDVNSALSWNKIGFVNGSGTSTKPNTYTFKDKSFSQFGIYKYRLKQIDIDGEYEYSNEIEVKVEVPLKFFLNQNYPNPFNPTTTLNFQLPEESFVTLKIYNSLGQEISTLINEVRNAGTHLAEFNSKDLGSGIYYAVLRTADNKFSQTIKMNLMK